jgi:hypothetical protein
MNGIGQTPLGPVEGTTVIVFFKDGDEKQHPVMIGTLPGIPVANNTHEGRQKCMDAAVKKIIDKSEDTTPTEQYDRDQSIGFKDPNGIYPRDSFLEEPDTNRLARNNKVMKNTSLVRRMVGRTKSIKMANSTGTWDQPAIPYAAIYPFNHVMETESGHTVEYDDTPGCERTCHQHRSGTFTEIDAAGTQVNKIVGNGYTIIDKDGYVSINGNCVVNVDGDLNLRVGGSIHLDAKTKLQLTLNDTDLEFKCKSFKVDCESMQYTIAKEFNIKAEESVSLNTLKKLNIQALEDISLETGSNVHVHASGNINEDAAQIHLNSGTAAPTAPTDPIVVSIPDYKPIVKKSPVIIKDEDVSKLTPSDLALASDIDALTRLTGKA